MTEGVESNTRELISQRKKQTVSPMTPLKSGQAAPFSGQYEIVGPRLGRTGIERTVTKGEPMPPVLERGQKYVLVDKTKH